MRQRCPWLIHLQSSRLLATGRIALRTQMPPGPWLGPLQPLAAASGLARRQQRVRSGRECRLMEQAM